MQTLYDKEIILIYDGTVRVQVRYRFRLIRDNYNLSKNNVRVVPVPVQIIFFYGVYRTLQNKKACNGTVPVPFRELA